MMPFTGLYAGTTKMPVCSFEMIDNDILFSFMINVRDSQSHRSEIKKNKIDYLKSFKSGKTTLLLINGLVSQHVTHAFYSVNLEI